MKKITLVALFIICALNSFAIDPAGSRVDFDEGGVDIPTPILIIGLIIATIGCFAMGMAKNADGKRDSTGMLWLGALGVAGLFIIFGNL